MSAFTFLLSLHLTTVVLTISLFVLRYWWRFTGNPRAQARWVRLGCHSLKRSVCSQRRLAVTVNR